ncbi:uncharacterized protein LOC143881309 isoform X2 [Tasmannia lanceolata]|uniref:uncharacterized protein LOC143881309 isoform X2 n=1 Tax=Tasmannia lanceolata TaxID=3420 RepID=UPI004063F486
MGDVVSMGILLDIVEEEWMRDTLPDDDVPLPPEVATWTEDVEDNSRVFSRSNSDANFQGSPESAEAARGGLISFQYYRNTSATVSHGPGSGSS